MLNCFLEFYVLWFEVEKRKIDSVFFKEMVFNFVCGNVLLKSRDIDLIKNVLFWKEDFTYRELKFPAGF